MDDFKIGQLTKELVAIELKKMVDPCAAAAELVKKTLAVALKSAPTDDSGRLNLIVDACKGGITGLLLAEQSLARGAVLMVEAVAELSTEFNLDPAEAMKAALRGISDVHRFARADQLQEIRHEIETRFMGAGEAFSEVLDESRRKTAAGKPT